jgi:hypothetical protein
MEWNYGDGGDFFIVNGVLGVLVYGILRGVFRLSSVVAERGKRYAVNRGLNGTAWTWNPRWIRTEPMSRIERCWAGNQLRRRSSRPRLSALPMELEQRRNLVLQPGVTVPGLANVSLSLRGIALQSLLEDLLYARPISRLHGAPAAFFNSSGQLTITFNGSGLDATPLTKKR